MADSSPEPETEQDQKAGFLAKLRKVADFVISQWLTIGFGLACLLGHFFPRKQCGRFYPELESFVARKKQIAKKSYRSTGAMY